MPWSNQTGGGPWGRPPNGGSGGGSGGPGGGPTGGPGGGPSPWGGGPSSNGSNSGGPDLEEMLRRSQERLRSFLPNGWGGRAPWAIGFVVLLAVWAASGLYTVGPNEVGLNLVFGRYVGKTGPGLNFNWPFPIGSVIKPQVTDRNAIDVGFDGRASLRSNADEMQEVPAESLMLTGDQNIADVKFRVIWQIDPLHPEDFVFNINRPADTVKAVAESAMREIVGRATIQDLLTVDRSQIEPAAQELIQQVLDRYKAGVSILQVQLLPVDPPEQVIAAFKDVTVAQQDKDRLQNEAQTYANKVVPEARGAAAAIVQQAEAYRQQTIAQASGQAAAFDQVYASYRAAPAVTRERIYLETMEKALGDAPKTVIDQKNGPGVVPYLPLPAMIGAGESSAPETGAAARMQRMGGGK